MTRLFIGTLKRVAFGWFMKLLAGLIKTWDDLEKLFLTRFFEDVTKILVPTLLTRKESLSKHSSIDFGAWHSVVLEA